ncbi:hypothetical protein BDV95DRAFT_497925 [Massariosphaeria phaeospora]|uniref:Uncharacterized protein n=1 Tax=Massariosphaeria phaeospora TaxID=100035 RepID=A0A7C8M6G7_9PLEO|nr:hypothetical protein BDV95DRAFT_497925 [Massariosphaeria phaeospora]
MQGHIEAPQSATTTSPTLTRNGDYGLVNNKYPFDSDTRSLLSTAKPYDYHESRKLLFRTGSYRLFVTLMSCFLIGITLKSYEGFKESIILSKIEIRIFNAIMIGLSLALGLNLASSLKRYAVALRWSLLTKRYVSLEVFDLILGLETLTNVAKLMVISLPGIRKVKMLRNLPWFREARDDGTKLTWIACLAWIVINVGAQILVASLSLFWPVDPSDAMPLLTYGNITVADLSTWKIDTPATANEGIPMEAAWSYGMEASVYPDEFELNDIQRDISSLPGTPIYKGQGFYEYKFFNRNPDQQYKNYVVSKRSVRATASCKQLETRGETVDVADEPLYIEGREKGQDWKKYQLPAVTQGSISWIGATFEHCGPRCTNFTVYQEQYSDDIKHPSLFLCENTLSEILGGEQENFVNLRLEDTEHINGNDDWARYASGAIAWTGVEEMGWKDRSTRTYLAGSKWSPSHIVNIKEVEGLLSRYTIGAVAAFDDHGVRYTVPNQYTRPVQGQQLNVDWPWVLGIMGAICVIQVTALFCLVNFANKSIIRDESSFGLAMLLRPVVNRVGREGVNLTLDEIKTHPKLLWKRIRYDYREGKEGEPNQVDIFFQGKDVSENRRSWASGMYS